MKVINYKEEIVGDEYHYYVTFLVEDEKTKISINSSGRMSRDEVIEYAKEIY